MKRLNNLTVYEFDALLPGKEADGDGLHFVPRKVFDWLNERCYSSDENNAWLRPARRQGRRAVQITNYAGVIQIPGQASIEVLPKIGKKSDEVAARQRLIEMLSCFPGFRHIQVETAQLLAKKMPLLEVFIRAFLESVQRVVKYGLRSQYVRRQNNLFAFRGKLLIAQHLRQNLCRADRFYVEYDEFSIDRPENRLIRAALEKSFSLTSLPENQRLNRELLFAFANVPCSIKTDADFQLISLDREMRYYDEAISWARLLLKNESPVSSLGTRHSPSLLFPMEAIFEAYVAKHLRKQIDDSFHLLSQSRGKYLVRHIERDMFLLKPDLLVCEGEKHRMVLDTKWKLIDSKDRADKYDLSSSDFYQLYAYGHHYLKGEGDVVLIYPAHDDFQKALPPFCFNEPKDKLRLWVLPFSLEKKTLVLPNHEFFPKLFHSSDA